MRRATATLLAAIFLLSLGLASASAYPKKGWGWVKNIQNSKSWNHQRPNDPTFGQVMNAWFTNPRWFLVNEGNGWGVVDFTGGFVYGGRQAIARFRMSVNEDEWKIKSLTIDGANRTAEIERIVNRAYADWANGGARPIPQPLQVQPNKSDGYLIPYSDRRLIDPGDISWMNKATLRLARNEIYARHGYIFKSADLRRYFGAKAWYRPNPYFQEGDLSTIEKKNIAIIKMMEQ